MNVPKPFLLSKDECANYTLFIDRDGVINQPIVDDYARTPDDFIFVDGAVDAIGQLKQYFGKIILITNQQGIHRELMSEKDLENIHLKMYHGIKDAGYDYFDLAFFAPYLRTANHIWRKPGKGMIMKAMEYFPDIDHSKLVVVGDSPGDMELAGAIDAIKVRISNPQFNFDDQDVEYASLKEFVENIE